MNQRTFEAMEYDGSLDSYWAICDWMKSCGNTNALANEVRFSTNIVTFPGPASFEAAYPGDWIARVDGHDHFCVLTVRGRRITAVSLPVPAEETNK